MAQQETTWQPPEEEIVGPLSSGQKRMLPDSAFAYPKQRKLPMVNPAEVQTAIAMFCRTLGMSDEDREQAFNNIKKAGEHFHRPVLHDNWQEVCMGMGRPQSPIVRPR